VLIARSDGREETVLKFESPKRFTEGEQDADFFAK
jgi:hypothetical protein